MTHVSGDPELAEILPQALAAARVERRRVLDEKEAFVAFRSRVVSIESGDSTHHDMDRRGVANGTHILGGGGPSTTTLSVIRDAYESTVMSVPHYEQEYNDMYPQSVAKELGSELAGALTQGATFHAKCKRRLLDMLDTVIEIRERFAGHLDREYTSVEYANDNLAPMIEEVSSVADEPMETKGFGTLEAFRTRIGILADQCESLATRRQETLADHESAILDDMDIPSYLYQDLSISYPVLATVGELSLRIESLKACIDRQIADF